MKIDVVVLTETVLFLQIELKLKANTCFGQLGTHHQAQYEEYRKGIFTALITDLRSQLYNRNVM